MRWTKVGTRPGSKAAPGATSTRSALEQTFALLKAYAVQETVGPLRHLGRRLAFGLAGASLLGVGLVLLLLSVLRVLQTETGTVFAGNMSFAPYLLTVVLALGIVGVAAAVGLKGQRGRSDRRGG